MLRFLTRPDDNPGGWTASCEPDPTRLIKRASRVPIDNQKVERRPLCEFQLPHTVSLEVSIRDRLKTRHSREEDSRTGESSETDTLEKQLLRHQQRFASLAEVDFIGSVRTPTDLSIERLPIASISEALRALDDVRKIRACAEAHLGYPAESRPDFRSNDSCVLKGDLPSDINATFGLWATGSELDIICNNIWKVEVSRIDGAFDELFDIIHSKPVSAAQSSRPPNHSSWSSDYLGYLYIIPIISDVDVPSTQVYFKTWFIDWNTLSLKLLMMRTTTVSYICSEQ
ncbi:hypothetical protein H4Q26_001604 [Puccinia striiformis f. sp. tritici PST-130]|nr:hypothetical protein H4Q26_001604 [Puccinia striiformis f. sp. tritici PST-130]